jgi:hypothetical protein
MMVRHQSGRLGRSITMSQLLRLSLGPLSCLIKRYRLQAELRRLHMHAGYFQW